MRLLIDIGHPGHVHLFKHVAHLLEADGHTVFFTARDKEFELHLLRAEDFPFTSLGKHYKTLPGKIFGLFRFTVKMLAVARRFKPDLFLSHGSIYAANAAFLTGRPHLSLEDSGNMEQIVLYRPFTDAILTPDVLPEELGKKQVRYPGYHEIAYLHPRYFSPNPDVYRWLGLARGEPFVLLRFVSWNATHDASQRGLGPEDKARLVRELSQQARVFISSESALPPELKPYQLALAPERLHHAMAFASLVVSEGATIASEAGILGTPSVYINTIARSYCQDQERYGLVFNTSDPEEVFRLIPGLLREPKETFRQRRDVMLADKVDVTRYVYDFITQRYIGRKGVLEHAR